MPCFVWLFVSLARLAAAGSFPYLTCMSKTCCMLQPNGIPTCWGDDIYGTCSSTPDFAFSQIDCGAGNCCGVKQTDSSTHCWGNYYGATNLYTSPDDTGMIPSTTFIEVFMGAGGNNACGIKADKTLSCWGRDSHYFSGSPPSFAVNSVSVYSFWALAIKEDGTLYSWGVASVSTPTSYSNTQFSKVAVGSTYGCGIKQSDNQIECWGSPTEVVGNNVPRGAFSDVSGGEKHVCALKISDSTAICWGQSLFGETEAPAGIAFQALSCDYYQSHGLTLDGRIMHWGKSWFVTATTTTTTTSIAPIACSAEDSCRGCRDGSITMLHPQNSDRIVGAGGYCFLSDGDVCVDIYSHEPCSADVSACPTEHTKPLPKPRYLQPVWKQTCGNTGARVVMGPAGCKGSFNSTGFCLARRNR